MQTASVPTSGGRAADHPQHGDVEAAVGHDHLGAHPTAVGEQRRAELTDFGRHMGGCQDHPRGQQVDPATVGQPHRRGLHPADRPPHPRIADGGVDLGGVRVVRTRRRSGGHQGVPAGAGQAGAGRRITDRGDHLIPGPGEVALGAGGDLPVAGDVLVVAGEELQCLHRPRRNRGARGRRRARHLRGAPAEAGQVGAQGPVDPVIVFGAPDHEALAGRALLDEARAHVAHQPAGQRRDLLGIARRRAAEGDADEPGRVGAARRAGRVLAEQVEHPLAAGQTRVARHRVNPG